MEASFTTLTDNQRLEALNTIYKKGLTTPKGELAFSSDKLVYLKPFLNRLQFEAGNNSQVSLSNLSMVRQVIDELLMDIWDEVEVLCSRTTDKVAEKIALEYGLLPVINQLQTNYYLAKKVA